MDLKVFNSPAGPVMDWGAGPRRCAVGPAGIGANKKECDGKTPATFESWYRGVLWEMQTERTDPRRNRINPRVIKRKMSKWKKKRPEHRHLPPLKKTFPEAVVMRR